MVMTTVHAQDLQTEHHSIMSKIAQIIQGDKFKSWAGKIHKTVDYKVFAERLERENSFLQENRVNFVEWYLKCQQINAEIVANLLSAIAIHAAEKVTEVPVIKQLSGLIDQLVITGLNLGAYVLHHGKSIHDDSAEAGDLSWWQEWYKDHIEITVREIEQSVKSIRDKHDKKENLSSDHQRLSALAATVQITASLIKLQARIITGLISVPAQYAGHRYNDLIEELKVGDFTKSLGNMVKELMKMIIEIPLKAEIIALRKADEIGELLTKVDELDDGDTMKPTGVRF